MSQIDSTREHLIETYRKKAKHYDITSRLYPVPGYPQRAQRLRAVQALGLRPGDSVVEIACGTGLNFPLIEQAIGPDGRIVGVDLTDAMLAHAQDRIETNGWSNVSLVQADAAEFDFPTEVDAILSTYALSHLPESGEVIAHGAAALSRGGRWVVLDLKVPDNAPPWLGRLGTALVRPFGSIDEWIMRRPWEAIRAAMREVWPIPPGPSCASGPHSSPPGPAALGPSMNHRARNSREAGRSRSFRPGPPARAHVGVLSRRVRRAGELHARQRDSGTGASGRDRTRDLRAGPVLRSCGSRTVHHPGAGLHLSGGGLELERHWHCA